MRREDPVHWHPESDGGGFWAISKYPPSPVFVLATLGMMIVMLAWLRRLDNGTSLASGWRIPLTYGRTPLFYRATVRDREYGVRLTPIASDLLSN